MSKTKKIILIFSLMTTKAFAGPQMPADWTSLKIAEQGLVRIEGETDENGLYVEYRGLSRDALLRRVFQSMEEAGYALVGTALNGAVAGFAKDQDRLALKIDQFGDSLYLAIFNEKGKEPLLHGIVFGQYTARPAASDDEAKGMLLKELER